ncbi:hypothetical protein M3Y94_00859800 [Aphelenchoides besseyi]|nr:hypothetical protein M3Y94_00859800 [Aphelenchoides besseyi]
MNRFVRFLLNNKEINLIVTSLFIFLSIYGSVISIAHLSFWDPLSNAETIPAIPSNRTDEVGVLRENVDAATNVISLLLLWTLASIFGRLVSYAKLPPLLGMLMAGILVRNVSFLSTVFCIDSDWSRIITKLAVILILMRCGINLQPEVLRNSWASFLSLGFVSTTVEAAAIFVVSFLILETSIPMAIAFAYVLCSTSPAVTVPSMIRLQDKQLGVAEGIPTILLASATIDNIYCIVSFVVCSSLSTAGGDKILMVIVSVVLQIGLGFVIGIIVGLFLRYFPRSNMSALAFVRCSSLAFASMALVFGSKAMGFEAFGPVAVLIACFVVSIKWKSGSEDAGKTEETCFRLTWLLVFQPLLFVLIGLLFEFSQLTWKTVGLAVCVLFTGVAVRFAAVLLISLPMKFKLKRKFFISVCFFPKATIQAALAPMIAQFATEQTPTSTVSFMLQTCVLSILITAPIGQVIIDRLGVVLLKDGQNVSATAEESTSESKSN